MVAPLLVVRAEERWEAGACLEVAEFPAEVALWVRAAATDRAVLLALEVTVAEEIRGPGAVRPTKCARCPVLSSGLQVDRWLSQRIVGQSH